MGQFSQSNAIRSIEGNLRDIYREYGPDLSKVRNKDTLKTYKALEARYAQELSPEALDKLKKLYQPKTPVVLPKQQSKEVDAESVLNNNSPTSNAIKAINARIAKSQAEVHVKTAEQLQDEKIDKQIAYIDESNRIWKEAGDKAYGSASGSTNASVASSSYSRGTGPEFIHGVGLNFERGEAAQMNRDRAYNTSGRAAGFERILAAREAKDAALHLAHQEKLRAEFAEFEKKAKSDQEIIASHLKADATGRSLAELPELHYITKTGKCVSGPHAVIRALEKDYPNEYKGITENLVALQKEKKELAETEKTNRLLKLKAGDPNTLSQKDLNEIRKDLDRINEILGKSEPTRRNKVELKNICIKYGFVNNSEGVEKVVSLINTNLEAITPESIMNSRLTAQVNAGAPTNALSQVKASNQEAASVSTKDLAKAGANLRKLLSDVYQDIIMPPLPSNAGQYQTASISASPQETKVDEKQIKEENKKLYYAHLSAINKGENPDPRKFDIPHSLAQLEDAQRVVKEKMKNPTLPNETKAKFEKFAAFLDKAIELKSA